MWRSFCCLSVVAVHLNAHARIIRSLSHTHCLPSFPGITVPGANSFALAEGLLRFPLDSLGSSDSLSGVCALGGEEHEHLRLSQTQKNAPRSSGTVFSPIPHLLADSPARAIGFLELCSTSAAQACAIVRETCCHCSATASVRTTNGTGDAAIAGRHGTCHGA